MLTHYSKLPDTTLHENPFSGSQFVTYTQTKKAKLIQALSQDSFANFTKKNKYCSTYVIFLNF
jgi:hypothetical protein